MKRIVIFLTLIFLVGVFIFGSNYIDKNTLKEKFYEKHAALYKLNLPGVINTKSPEAINLRICSFLSSKGAPDLTYLSPWYQNNKDKVASSKYWIIQFYGPILPDWRKAINKANLKIIDYIPNYSYLVEGSYFDIVKLKVKHLLRWFGPWQAPYKVQPELFLFESDNDVKIVPLTISSFRGAKLNNLEGEIKSVGGKILKKSIGEKIVLNITIPSKNISALSLFEDIKWIQIDISNELCNNIARSSDDIPTGRGPDPNDTNDNGPLMNVDAVWDKGIHGEGIIVAEADTGLDTGDLSTLHEDFGKQGDPNNPMRVIKTYALGRSTWDDPNAHGTHTAGSMCGNGYHSGSEPWNDYFPSTCYAGTAPKAELVFQSVLDSNGGLGGIPNDLHDLFQDPYNDGARVHSNSWGARINGQYDQRCVDTDDFIWNNPDMVIVFAAGNTGKDNDNNGVVDLDGIDSPGAAKNVICVGSSENYRPDALYEDNGNCVSPTWSYVWGFSTDPIASDLMADNASGMAAFSGRGPVDDGRIKPDVVAPGTFVLSTKSQEVQDAGDGQCNLSNNDKEWYVYRSGTSMSTPLVSGCCALIQQYYKEGWFVHGVKEPDNGINPSAALVKATLLNGAWDMYPGQYGTGQYQEIPTKRPNNVEGWGRVDLYNSLYFSGDNRNLIFDDHTTGITTGETVSYTVCNQSSSEPLKFTLVWTDPAGSANASKELVNDLDLKVTAPDGTVYYPNNGNSEDRTNNIESIDIPVSELQLGEYTVEVSGYNVPGNGSSNSDQQPFALVISGGGINFGSCCTSYPPAPTNLTTSLPSQNEIRLDWDVVNGADHYNIYRSEGECPGSTFTYLDSSTTNYYIDNSVSAGNTYSYKVTAVDSNGCESQDFSNCSDNVPYGNCTDPPTFGGLESVAPLSGNGCALKLTWSPATNNCTGDSSGIVYNIYRSTTSGFTPSDSNLIASCVTNTYYYDTNVSSNTIYYYIVRAEDSTTNGSGPCNHGNEDTNTVEKSGGVGGTLDLFDEDFESEASGWGYFLETDGYDGGGNSSWHLTSAQHHSGSYSAHCGSSGTQYENYTDFVLFSPAISIPSDATSATLTFYQYYYNEDRYDGTQLYISNSQNSLGSLVTDPDPAYTRTISSNYNSPIGGQKAWSGDHETWDLVTVDLSAYAGQTIYIQWRFASDESVTKTGYYLDDVHVECEVPDCTHIPDDVKFFNITGSDSQAVIEWVNPDSYTNCSTVVRYSDSGFPQNVNDGLLVCNNTGQAGEKDSYTLGGLTNGKTYYFTCFVVSGDQSSAGRRLAVVPRNVTNQPWNYATSSTTLMPSGVYINLAYFGNNSREFHGLDASDGTWHGNSWTPILTNGPIQDRAPIVPYNLNGASMVVFFSSQDGRVYAVDADTSNVLWISDVLGNMIEGAPAGSFTQYNADYDYIYAVTRNDDTSQPNKLYALNANDGTIAWTFDNGASGDSSKAIGAASGAPIFDYSTGNIIFATRSRSGGSSDTLWCIHEDGTKVWSVDIGDSDNSPTYNLGVVYIGTLSGKVYAVSEADGNINWSIDLGDGPINSYISVDWLSGDIFASTANHVWRIKDNGNSASIVWSKAIDSPTSSVVAPKIGYMYVGSSDGTLHQISLDGNNEKTMVIGDGSENVGAPSYDCVSGTIYVGTVDGTYYAVRVPF